MSEQKKRKVETSNDPNVWLKWYHELSDESDLSESSKDEDESDKEEENILTESEHNTESEQEVAESEEVESDEDVPLDSSSFYIGKDKITKWRKANPPRNVKTRSHNIIIHLPGPKGKAREVKTEVADLELFLDDNILKTITACTNIYIEKTRQEFTRGRDARSTDEIEIRAFIGLLFLIGTMRCSRKNIYLLWDNSKGNGIESCYLTMSEQRFRFLLRCLRFDNINDRNMRKELDKMAAIREVFELFTNNFEKYFSPSEYLTIDEQLLAFRGRAAFRQYISNKPSKYGIKTFALVDAKTAYTMKLETYVGLQPPGPYQQSNNAKDIVMRMVEPVQGTNRNITGDNWFTSIPLVNELLTEKKLTYVGTLRKNKREIPKEFLPQKDRDKFTSIFGFQENCTIVSYCLQKNKAVLAVSTMHHDSAISEDTGEYQKPDIITFYNSTKIGVDLVDQICQKK
ncbi:unnamed protein product [Acanthoscelides obtectus]|uniref:PiggyBac transposable element-derived protein domain-containing protein n=1 Tax=Acanthoscelides obtectus TaxID=200917 RepID=A0A9P0LA69_ACAOB|nr:unnamed protein product [Acanthoscelides obtectus]CAK1620848.1 PiggyBac transposable element-derived protein 4 [Acanthoscelides obtectus]